MADDDLLGCPVLVSKRTINTTADIQILMSAFGGEADVRGTPPKSPLLANKRHSSTISTAWILRSLVVSLLGEGDRAWNAGLPPFLLLT